ncbi:hypothetical protein DSM104299_03473 [Baekduia alba]|uniref:hypothetical protein n=1 Tax=Baekduia alba TaxID=2997333 RepID=UPI00233F89FE|nr:hypothetical protein [Baekduia alba]WCB94734.1 hypothetical protein DSM104299_03473 [Baekduia alba]
MSKSKIAGAVAALALLAAPSVAAAHDGRHHHGHHHKHHAKAHEVTGTATATVASFAGDQLTLTLPSGKTFAATVGPKTVIRCVTAAPQTPATTARHGHGDDDGGDDRPNHDAKDDNGQGDVNGNGACGTAALVAGAKVSFAKLSLAGGDATWKKVVILK